MIAVQYQSRRYIQIRKGYLHVFIISQNGRRLCRRNHEGELAAPQHFLNFLPLRHGQ